MAKKKNLVFQFHYNLTTHQGLLDVVERLNGEAYIASSKKELRELKATLAKLAPALANAVGESVDPECDGVGVMLLDLVSTDEELEAERRAKAAD